MAGRSRVVSVQGVNAAEILGRKRSIAKREALSPQTVQQAGEIIDPRASKLRQLRQHLVPLQYATANRVGGRGIAGGACREIVDRPAEKMKSDFVEALRGDPDIGLQSVGFLK